MQINKHPIAIFRESLGLSREQLAAQLGLSGPSLWRIENDKQRPSYETLAILEKMSGGSVRALDIINRAIQAPAKDVEQ